MGIDIHSINLDQVPHARLRALPPGWALAVVDGSCRDSVGGQPGSIHVGGIIVDRDGREIQRFCRAHGEGFPADAEYLAIRTALRMGVRMGLHGLEVHTDCQSVARALKYGKPRTYKSDRLSSINQSVNDLMRQIGRCRVKWVGRKNVRQGHCLARLSYRHGTSA